LSNLDDLFLRYAVPARARGIAVPFETKYQVGPDARNERREKCPFLCRMRRRPVGVSQHSR